MPSIIINENGSYTTNTLRNNPDVSIRLVIVDSSTGKLELSERYSGSLNDFTAKYVTNNILSSIEAQLELSVISGESETKFATMSTKNPIATEFTKRTGVSYSPSINRDTGDITFSLISEATMKTAISSTWNNTQTSLTDAAAEILKLKGSIELAQRQLREYQASISEPVLRAVDLTTSEAGIKDSLLTFMSEFSGLNDTYTELLSKSIKIDDETKNKARIAVDMFTSLNTYLELIGGKSK